MASNSVSELAKKKSCNVEQSFASPKCLYEWLKPRMSIESFSEWGIKTGTKNVDNLWLELSQGECILIDSNPTPLRVVECVVVSILDSAGRVLIEAEQELSDGTLRKRGRPLSEKMKGGEEAESAFFRAIKEELGVDDAVNKFKIVEGSYRKVEEERLSDSYVGLPCLYIVHKVHVRGVDDNHAILPSHDFVTEEEEYSDCIESSSVATKAVHIKKHHWTWALKTDDN